MSSAIETRHLASEPQSKVRSSSVAGKPAQLEVLIGLARFDVVNQALL